MTPRELEEIYLSRTKEYRLRKQEALNIAIDSLIKRVISYIKLSGSNRYIISDDTVNGIYIIVEEFVDELKIRGFKASYTNDIGTLYFKLD